MKPRYFKFEVFEQESIPENEKQTKKDDEINECRKTIEIFYNVMWRFIKTFFNDKQNSVCHRENS